MSTIKEILLHCPYCGEETMAIFKIGILIKHVYCPECESRFNILIDEQGN